jgi:hypothetical protein
VKPAAWGRTVKGVIAFVAEAPIVTEGGGTMAGWLLVMLIGNGGGTFDGWSTPTTTTGGVGPFAHVTCGVAEKTVRSGTGKTLSRGGE